MSNHIHRISTDAAYKTMLALPCSPPPQQNRPKQFPMSSHSKRRKLLYTKSPVEGGLQHQMCSELSVTNPIMIKNLNLKTFPETFYSKPYVVPPRITQPHYDYLLAP